MNGIGHKCDGECCRKMGELRRYIRNEMTVLENQIEINPGNVRNGIKRVMYERILKVIE
jgi:hypothetical protein